jgi:tRNA(Ile)-lysidine synthase
MAASGAPWPAVVAVSGGSDSLALMHLLADWARARGVPPPLAVCVDHGLRPESAAEAKKVVAWARKAKLRATTLKADMTLPANGLEAAARALRYRLIGYFARKHQRRAVYVAHTRDDQAETFLLRLARGSGVDGLAGMRAVAPYPAPEFLPLAVVRPLLGLDRHALRAFLVARGQPWIDDPMNADGRFARVRIRQAWEQLAVLGLTPARLAETAGHLARARSALETAAEAVLLRVCRPAGQGLAIDPVALAGAPPELGLRALAGVLMAVSANPYRPRFERLTALFTAITAGGLGGGRTLHGCAIAPAPKRWQAFGPETLLVTVEKGRNRHPAPRGS